MLNDANAYFDGTISGDLWNGFPDAEKEKALKEAARMISLLSLSNVPSNIQNAAIYEQALCLLTMDEGTKQRIAMQAQGIRSIRSSHAAESYTDNAGGSKWGGLFFCPKVQMMLDSFVRLPMARAGSMTRGRYPRRW